MVSGPEDKLDKEVLSISDAGEAERVIPKALASDFVQRAETQLSNWEKRIDQLKSARAVLPSNLTPSLLGVFEAKLQVARTQLSE